jgi:hypothetical protein
MHDPARIADKALLLDIKIQRYGRMVIIECHAGDDGHVQSSLLKQGSQVRDAIPNFLAIGNIAIVQVARLPQVGILRLLR